MERLQSEIATTAVFEDSGPLDPDRIGKSAFGSDQTGQSTLDDHDSTSHNDDDSTTLDGDDPLTIVGIDQAFREDDGEAISVAVACRGGEIVEQVHAVAPLEIPYVPGLLAFREGEAIARALEALSVEPDCLLLDGSGRIHYRQVGIATHVSVLFDLAAVGVAKSLLCGTPTGSVDDLAVGERVPIEADDSVTAPDGTVLGYAVQTRQYDSPNRSINPIYVSPGHRVCAETAADIAAATCSGYKLPEPIRLADRRVGELARET